MRCRCVSCSISRVTNQDKIPKELGDMFLLGYYYYAMTHKAATEDAGWYEEGVEFYSKEILEKDFPTNNKRIKYLIKIIKEAKE